MFDQGGHEKRTIGGDGQFYGPRGISIKGDVMYVADTSNDLIQKLTTGGQFLQKFGQHGSGQGQFDGPVSVIVDQRDRMIVADSDNHRVVILDQNGSWLLSINGNVFLMLRVLRIHGVLPWTLMGTSMLQPMVLTPSKSSHQRGPMSDHMEM